MNEDQNNVSFGYSDYIQLTKIVKKCKVNNIKQFNYKGNDYLTVYAEYLIEYLATKFKN
jgi:hypothetical protein